MDLWGRDRKIKVFDSGPFGDTLRKGSGSFHVGIYCFWLGVYDS
jgi:hypothetical protein